MRDFVQAAEALSYSHLVVYEHVVGVAPRGRTERAYRYTDAAAFLEPMPLLGFVSGLTSKLELATGVLVLPERPTALVAKQAASLDVLSHGRLRMGFGIGANRLEFEALGADFANRAARIEEQIGVLRLLWTQDVVDFRGRWHVMDGVGINPLPVQRPIPLWLGGSADRAMDRAARLGDGWFAQVQPGEDPASKVHRFRRLVHRARRDVRSVGAEWRVDAAGADPARWAKRAEELRRTGFTHVHFNTMGAGFRTTDEHVDAIERFRRSSDSLFASEATFGFPERSWR